MCHQPTGDSSTSSIVSLISGINGSLSWDLACVQACLRTSSSIFVLNLTWHLPCHAKHTGLTALRNDKAISMLTELSYYVAKIAANRSKEKG